MYSTILPNVLWTTMYTSSNRHSTTGQAPKTWTTATTYFCGFQLGSMFENTMLAVWHQSKIVRWGPVACKTRLQPTVALLSTEAEFMAACDAAKMFLFIRSILWDLGNLHPCGQFVVGGSRNPPLIISRA